MSSDKEKESWTIDQMTKSEFFHQKLHEWALLEIAYEHDDRVDAREFDLWRGMAAGSQAQGSWQNTKGDKAEVVIKDLIERWIREKVLFFPLLRIRNRRRSLHQLLLFSSMSVHCF
jgi:hypothetical protein